MMLRKCNFGQTTREPNHVLSGMQLASGADRFYSYRYVFAPLPIGSLSCDHGRFGGDVDHAANLVGAASGPYSLWRGGDGKRKHGAGGTGLCLKPEFPAPDLDEEREASL